MFILRFSSLSKTYRHLQRYRDVTTVLLKHEFGDLVDKLGLKKYLPLLRRRKERTRGVAAHLSRYERLRLAFEELGPTFVKLGQLLSTRYDILPLELINEFEKLQDTVPPFNGDIAQSIVEEELGCPMTQSFRTFNTRPLASASIAQVHEAVTVDGERVVLKIRRPNIRSVIETDLEIMSDLARLLERMVEWAAVFEPVRVVQEFARVIHRELDLTIEAGNIERFQRLFEEDDAIVVPRIYRSLSSRRVLTMEYIEGTKISRIDTLPPGEVDCKVVASRGAKSIMQQVFLFGFFHGDPHPGNIMVLSDNRLCFLDYGIMGILPARRQEDLGSLIHGLVQRDEQATTAAIFRLSGYRRYENTELIEGEVAHFIQDHLFRPLRDVRIGPLMNELAHLLITYEIRFPSEFFLLTKAVTTIEGIGRQLYPDFNAVEFARPFATELVKERTSVRSFLKGASTSALELRSLLQELPSASREIMTLIRRGEAKLNFEHRGLEGLIASNDQISNRLVFAIVLASMVVGSSLMTLSGIPPTWFEIPIIGLAGFLVSGLMAFWLLVSIIRHGKM